MNASHGIVDKIDDDAQALAKVSANDDLGGKVSHLECVLNLDTVRHQKLQAGISKRSETMSLMCSVVMLCTLDDVVMKLVFLQPFQTNIAQRQRSSVKKHRDVNSAGGVSLDDLEMLHIVMRRSFSYQCLPCFESPVKSKTCMLAPART